MIVEHKGLITTLLDNLPVAYSSVDLDPVANSSNMIGTCKYKLVDWGYAEFTLDNSGEIASSWELKFNINYSVGKYNDFLMFQDRLLSTIRVHNNGTGYTMINEHLSCEVDDKDYRNFTLNITIM